MEQLKRCKSDSFCGYDLLLPSLALYYQVFANVMAYYFFTLFSYLFKSTGSRQCLRINLGFSDNDQ